MDERVVGRPTGDLDQFDAGGVGSLPAENFGSIRGAPLLRNGERGPHIHVISKRIDFRSLRVNDTAETCPDFTEAAVLRAVEADPDLVGYSFVRSIGRRGGVPEVAK